MATFKVILCDISAPLVEAWQRSFRDYPEIEIVHGSLLEVAADAYASPANSFGIMEKGFDAVLSRRFPLVQDNVQEAISARGEPIATGECLIVETADARVPYLLCAPTMLFPSSVANTNNAYLAMQAILDEVQHFNRRDRKIGSIAVPGLCTGVGGMNPDVAAQQMAEAYRSWLVRHSVLAS